MRYMAADASFDRQYTLENYLMKILLTNDDGICAQGIRILASALSREHEVTIVAPEGEQSGAGHSITVKRTVDGRAGKPGLE